MGKTPLVYHLDRRDRISAISGISVSPRRRHLNLFFQLHDHNIRQLEARDFLRHLLRHLRGHVFVLWDGGAPHRGRLVRQLCRQSKRLHLVRLPAYAPEFNPDEGIWKLAKQQLANGSPHDRDELRLSLLDALQAIRANRKNLRGCITHSALPPFCPNRAILYAVLFSARIILTNNVQLRGGVGANVDCTPTTRRRAYEKASDNRRRGSLPRLEYLGGPDPLFLPVCSGGIQGPGVNSTFWLTDLYITNVGSSTSTVGVKYFPSDVTNTFNGTFPKTITIAPGQNFSVTDVIGSWFPSYYSPPTVTATKGYMIIADVTPQNCNVSSPPSSYPGLFAVTSRTYNTGDVRRTYGMTIPPTMEGMNYTTYPSVITGVINTGTTAPGFRTNVSVANLSTRQISVRISAFKSDGSSAGTYQIKTILPLSFGQWSVSTQLGFSMGSLPGRIEVKLDPPSQVADPCTCVTNTFTTNPCSTGSHYALSSEPVFFAYAFLTDNGTGDGTFLAPVIDYKGYSAWKSSYTNANCPNHSCLKYTPVEECLRARGLGLLEEAPAFRKVTK